MKPITYKRVLLSLSLLLVLTLFLTCKNESKTKHHAGKNIQQKATHSEKHIQDFAEECHSKQSVLQIVMASPEHSILVSAIQAAELESSLIESGPLTVFAPTDAAFDELHDGTLENLMKPKKKESLANILKHHVTPGNYSKKFLKRFKNLKQANDQKTIVAVRGDDVFIGGAKITASIEASNGIVHVVDLVMFPPHK